MRCRLSSQDRCLYIGIGHPQVLQACSYRPCKSLMASETTKRCIFWCKLLNVLLMWTLKELHFSSEKQELGVIQESIKVPMCLVTQLCPTLCNLMDCSLPGSSVHGNSSGKNTRGGCHALLQGIFQTQGSNPGLPHCRWILYHLNHQGSSRIL